MPEAVDPSLPLCEEALPPEPGSCIQLTDTTRTFSPAWTCNQRASTHGGELSTRGLTVLHPGVDQPPVGETALAD